MELILHDDPLPLHADGHGGYRVGNSRITLDFLIRRFNDGKSPESLAHSFDTLNLADVYVVVGYYLRHKTEVDGYVEARQRQADELQRRIEASQPDKQELMARVRARWDAMQKKYAEIGNG